MRSQLPDPRRFDSRNKSPLMEAAESVVSAVESQRKSALRDLSQRVSTMLEQGEESIVRDALNRPTSPAACRALLQALDLALAPLGRKSGVNVSVFALPLLFVVGAASSANIDGVIPDTEEIRALFESAGTLGHCRNFGLSNALTELGALESIPWSALHAISRGDQWGGLAGLDLPPADITVTANQETLHLRFLVGAALTPGDAPGFLEAAGDIGRWGMSLTQLLGRQFAAQGVSLLAIPRLPRATLQAAQEGWYAAREMGFQLFLSNALRQARTRVGDPDVTISACSDQSIRIRLTSSFDDLFDQTYGWPLAPSDDFDEIVSSIFSLLKEARVQRFQVMPNVEDITGPKHPTH